MTRAKVGIIGGTGLGDVLMSERGGETVTIETPFGAPSAALLIT
ncbi:MAG: S-methyl-5'-thioadenosine phosphorylase, partial [Planctomycetes bacterium]|nr:S-methyl-5'-thioadenosine phosphorylase [Planctomycetota bacterium]